MRHDTFLRAQESIQRRARIEGSFRNYARSFYVAQTSLGQASVATLVDRVKCFLNLVLPERFVIYAV